MVMCSKYILLQLHKIFISDTFETATAKWLPWFVNMVQSPNWKLWIQQDGSTLCTWLHSDDSRLSLVPKICHWFTQSL